MYVCTYVYVYMYVCHIKSAMAGLDPDSVEVGNALCAVSPRLEQKGLDLDFPLAQGWTQRWPVEAQTLHDPKADMDREHKGGCSRGSGEEANPPPGSIRQGDGSTASQLQGMERESGIDEGFQETLFMI